MKVSHHFFDKVNWSLFATLQTLIILIIFKIGIPINQLHVLVFASILSMMKGKLLPKLIYTFFLCLMVWKDNKEFIVATILSIVSVIITHYIKENNKIYSFIKQNSYLKFIVIIAIAIWMIYIPYLLYKKLKL